MKRVICLYRSDCKEETKESFLRQKMACHKLVSRTPDWKIVQEYFENGVPGLSTVERVAIRALQSAAQKAAFDVLLVYSVDRLGRDASWMFEFAKWLKQHNIETRGVVEGQLHSALGNTNLVSCIRYWQNKEGEGCL